MDAVEQVEQRQILMMPPTWLTCLDVGQHTDPTAVLDEAQERHVEIFMPEVVAGRRRLHPVDAAALLGADGDAMTAESGWSGGSFGDTGTCVLAPNADVMTLDGTNTWVLRDPDSSRSVVVDPGSVDRRPPRRDRRRRR